ncbi:thiolase family protein [Mumia sp. Pv 4-285]|uniref:thiolase family protein n=1 Tax=Mumia qirimensis TaxID=3234852 RepID=UPI00351D7D0B
MRDAVIVGAVRTPIGKRNGAYADVHPVDLSAHTLRALVDRVGLDPAAVDDVVWGCVQQVGAQALNVGRLAVLAAGWPETVPGTTVDRQCGSSQQAVHFAAAAVVSGQADVVVAGGVESMSIVPLGATSVEEYGRPYGPMFAARYPQTPDQGIGAEMVAEKWGLSRAQLDEYALRSHERSVAAIQSGAFDSQYALVPGTGLTTDQGVRPDTSLEVLSSLRPAFKEDGVIHAGNSSQISDGAGALLITTSEKAKELGLRPLVRLRSLAVAGDDPTIMLTAPIPATAKALARAGLSIGDIGAYEINEAFASVPLAWLAETQADPERLNPLGGAISVGHPLGGSGAALMTRLVHSMVDNDIQYGLQSMCEGGGMANATVLERV